VNSEWNKNSLRFCVQRSAIGVLLSSVVRSVVSSQRNAYSLQSKTSRSKWICTVLWNIQHIASAVSGQKWIYNVL